MLSKEQISERKQWRVRPEMCFVYWPKHRGQPCHPVINKALMNNNLVLYLLQTVNHSFTSVTLLYSPSSSICCQKTKFV